MDSRRGLAGSSCPVMRGLLPWILATILATLVTGLLVLTGILKLPRKPEAARILRLQIDAGHVGWHLMDIPVISPDGSRIAFTGTDEKRVRHLWIRPISFFQYQMVPGTEGAYRPFWSPDGKQIGFAANSKLQRVDLAGGALHVICDLGQEYSLYTVASWSPAGVIVFG